MLQKYIIRPLEEKLLRKKRAGFKGRRKKKKKEIKTQKWDSIGGLINIAFHWERVPLVSFRTMQLPRPCMLYYDPINYSSLTLQLN